MLTSLDTLATSLFQQTSLQNLQIMNSISYSEAFYSLLSAESTLKSLRFDYITHPIDFTNLTQMETLDLTYASDTSLETLLPTASTLKSLKCTQWFALTNLTNLSDFPVLETAKFDVIASSLSSSTVTLPENLKSLYINGASSFGVSIVATGSQFTDLYWRSGSQAGGLVSVPSTVTSLTLESTSTQNYNFTFPSALESLALRATGSDMTGMVVDSSIADCTHLSSFTLSAYNLSRLIGLFPASLRATNVTQLFLEARNIVPSPDSVTRMVCTALDPSKLTYSLAALRSSPIAVLRHHSLSSRHS